MMGELVWSTIKPQLFLTEAAHIKALVGRDRIRRNKDALKELRCLQEILSDLYSGAIDLGCEPEKRTALDRASACYAALQVEATNRGVKPEDVCNVPRALKRYLLTRPVRGHAPAAADLLLLRCNSEAATSTRAPSTTLELDAQSTTTAGDCRSEAAVLHEVVLGMRPGGQRLGCEQLDALGAQLVDQLEQEFTSLVSSIEEVQALMEAEVAELRRPPPVAELEAFCAAADAALTPARRRWADFSSESSEIDTGSCVSDFTAYETRDGACGIGSEALSPTRPARALCASCGALLGRSAFSRRAWRQARGQGSATRGTGSTPQAVCLGCTRAGVCGSKVTFPVARQRRCRR